MGGGRSGLFSGTAGADVYQQSLFSEPLEIRARGATYLPVEEGVPIGNTVVGGYSKNKLCVLTVKDILKKFMAYRFGEISESMVVRWLQATLTNEHYYIELSLRHILTRGLASLKTAKTVLHTYDRQKFLTEIEKIESEMLLQ